MSRPSLRLTFIIGIMGCIAQLVTTAWLMFSLREKGNSPVRDALWSAMFLPSNIVDFIVRAATHKSPAMVFGAFTADFLLGFILDAFVWALFAALLCLFVRGGFRRQTSNHAMERTADRQENYKDEIRK